MIYSLEELLLAGSCPRRLDLFKSYIRKGTIKLERLLGSRSLDDRVNLDDINLDTYDSFHQLRLILESLDSNDQFNKWLDMDVELHNKHRSRKLEELGLSIYCSQHYTSVGRNLDQKIKDFRDFLEDRASRLSPNRMESLDLNYQEVLDEINLETKKMEKTFKEKELNDLISRTMEEEEHKFPDIWSFREYLLDLVENLTDCCSITYNE